MISAMAMSTQTVQAAGATGAKTAMEPTLAAECSPSGPPSDTKESSHASKETGSPEETRLKLEVLRLLFKAENMPDLLQCSTGEVLAKYLCRNSRWQSSSTSPIHHLELSPATIDTLSTLQTNRTKLSTYYLLGHTLFSSESLSRIDAPFATRTKPSNLSVLDRPLILNVKNPDLANLFSQVKAPPADEYARCSIYRLGRGVCYLSPSDWRQQTAHESFFIRHQSLPNPSHRRIHITSPMRSSPRAAYGRASTRLPKIFSLSTPGLPSSTRWQYHIATMCRRS